MKPQKCYGTLYRRENVFVITERHTMVTYCLDPHLTSLALRKLLPQFVFQRYKLRQHIWHCYIEVS